MTSYLVTICRTEAYEEQIRVDADSESSARQQAKMLLAEKRYGLFSQRGPCGVEFAVVSVAPAAALDAPDDEQAKYFSWFSSRPTKMTDSQRLHLLKAIASDSEDDVPF